MALTGYVGGLHNKEFLLKLGGILLSHSDVIDFMFRHLGRIVSVPACRGA
jgi:hypothetical protein